MKKIILSLIITLSVSSVFSLKAFAQDIVYDDISDGLTFESDDYVPESIKQTLENAGVTVESKETLNNVLGFVSRAINALVNSFSKDVALLFVTVVFSSLFCKIIDNRCFKTIISYIIILIILVSVFGIVKQIVNNALDTLSSVREILNVVLPSFSAILLLGSSTFTALTESASFAVVLALLNALINNIILPVFIFLLFVCVFEHVSPQLNEMNLVKFLKKNIITALSFTTMILLTVISCQHIVSVGRDSVSGRTVKFAAAQFIPIIGAAFGESLKTIGAGLKFLKTSVGGAVMLSLLITVLPTVLEIIFAKLYLNFLSFTASVIGCKGEQGVFDTMLSVLDILNAIIICVGILSFLIIILFIISSFPVAS